MKTLNVKLTNRKEVAEKWGFPPVITPYFATLVIRCNKKGVVNWGKAPLYTLQELKGRNIVIH